MLFPDKSFCCFEINAWPLPPKNFTILTEKTKPGEPWKLRGLIVNISIRILAYLEDSSFRIILKRTECFSLTNLVAVLR